MEVIIELNDALDTATFYGVNNINILCLKNQHPDVRVVARGYQVKVIGSQPAISRFEQNLRKCEAFCIKNNTLNEEQILQILHGEQPTEFLQDNLILHGVNGKSIVARSANQQRLVDSYEENDLLFAIGPAGSGNAFRRWGLCPGRLQAISTIRRCSRAWIRSKQAFSRRATSLRMASIRADPPKQSEIRVTSVRDKKLSSAVP